MKMNTRIARELVKIARMLKGDGSRTAAFSATPAKDKVVELCEDGALLSWETVARECIDEMSEDDVRDMCSTLGIDVDGNERFI